MRRKRKFILIVNLLLLLTVMTTFFISESSAQRRYLYFGSTGSDVRILQRKLSQWGYYEGRIDGRFAGRTWAAVKEFQYRNRLRVDGIVGPETWGALGYAMEERRTGQFVPGELKVAFSGNVSRSGDVEMIARLIHAEARGEPYEGQVAVAAVLLNRVASPKFPNSISGVIYQPLAFESVANGQFNLPPTNDNRRAARAAVNGYDPTYGSLFFWNPSKPVSKWIWSRQIVRRIGGHVFAH